LRQTGERIVLMLVEIDLRAIHDVQVYIVTREI
jgi:hypothetical protein